MRLPIAVCCVMKGAMFTNKVVDPFVRLLDSIPIPTFKCVCIELHKHALMIVMYRPRLEIFLRSKNLWQYVTKSNWLQNEGQILMYTYYLIASAIPIYTALQYCVIYIHIYRCRSQNFTLYIVYRCTIVTFQNWLWAEVNWSPHIYCVCVPWELWNLWSKHCL
jgi:hypothetical protein